MADSARTMTDWLGFLGNRRPADSAPAAVTPTASTPELSHATKSLQKFLSCLQSHDKPVLLDLGPVVGSNVNFFGEQLGCRIRVEDLASDIEAHVKKGTAEELPAFFEKRFTQEAGSVDGILAWDSFFHLRRDDQRAMFATFRAHTAPGAALMFTSGPRDGEAIGTFHGEPLYHASLVPDEYRALLDRHGFEVVAHKAEDPGSGRHTIWLARLRP